MQGCHPFLLQSVLYYSTMHRSIFLNQHQPAPTAYIVLHIELSSHVVVYAYIHIHPIH